MARQVREIIDRPGLVEGSSEMSVKDAAARMAGARCGSILVTDEGRLLGIFTERDLLMRVVAEGRDPGVTSLGEVMSCDCTTIEADRPVEEAIRILDELSHRYLPVLESGRPIGVISVSHLPLTDFLAMGSELEMRHAIKEQLR